MKSIVIAAVAFAVCWSAGCDSGPQNAGPRETERRSEQRGPLGYSETLLCEYDIGDTVFATIDGIFGPITVKGSEGSKTKVIITKSANAKEMKNAERLVKEVQVKVEESEGSLRIKSWGPRDSRKFGEYGYETSIEVTIPQGSSMHVENKFGNISVANVHGNLNLKGRHGSIEVEDAGNVTVDNAFGSVFLSNLSGNAVVKNKHGSVRCYGLRGGSVVNTFGSIDISDPEGFVEARGEAGPMNLRNVSDIKFHNRIGDVVIQLAESFKGEVDIRLETPGTISSHIGIEPKTKPEPSTHGYILKGTLGKGPGKVEGYSETGTFSISK